MTSKIIDKLLDTAGDIIALAGGDEPICFNYRADHEDEYRFSCFVYAGDEAFHAYGATLSEALRKARADRAGHPELVSA